MLEDRNKYTIIGLEEPSKRAFLGKPLIEKIMKDSRGWIDLLLMTVNGTKIVFSESDDVEPKHIADAASSIAKATLMVMELFGAKNFNEIDLQVQEGRYLIIRGYRECYIAALTKPNPSLGLVKLALDRNLTSDRLLRKVMHVAQKAADARIPEEKSVTKGNRVPAYMIIEMIADGMSVKEILEKHPELTEDYVKATLEYAASVLKREAYCEIPSRG
ncbi:MAG: DUF433 domain-containing protein [Nitrososphaeria archaeon]|nr:DUF433 domain-containing protein [Aigarchaeota archaeon]MCX8187137.1 DUF433 domain-containing protein [Nitrososphaeria archaeon]MDW8021858.1 DUF433 domain-containing protein [Nitrososphaerota archaeon]